MLDKIIGFKIYHPVTGRQETVFPFGSTTHGKAEISVSGSIIGAETSSTVELVVTNYYPSMVFFDTKNNYMCEVVIGYKDTPNAMGTIRGQVLNVYTEYTGVDSKTHISINTGLYTQAIEKNISVNLVAGTPYSALISTIASKIGMKTALVTMSSTKLLKVPFVFNGNSLDAISKVKELIAQDGMSITIRNGVITAFEISKGSGYVHNVNMITSPIRMFDNGITVQTLFDPRIFVGDKIRISSKYFISTAGVFVTTSAGFGLETVYTVLRIDFSFSTTGSENSMTIIGVESDKI